MVASIVHILCLCMCFLSSYADATEIKADFQDIMEGNRFRGEKRELSDGTLYRRKLRDYRSGDADEMTRDKRFMRFLISNDGSMGINTRDLMRDRKTMKKEILRSLSNEERNAKRRFGINTRPRGGRELLLLRDYPTERRMISKRPRGGKRNCREDEISRPRGGKRECDESWWTNEII